MPRVRPDERRVTAYPTLPRRASNTYRSTHRHDELNAMMRMVGRDVTGSPHNHRRGPNEDTGGSADEPVGILPQAGEGSRSAWTQKM